MNKGRVIRTCWRCSYLPSILGESAVRRFRTAQNLPLRRFDASGQVVGIIAHLNHSMPAVGNDRFQREFEKATLAFGLTGRGGAVLLFTR